MKKSYENARNNLGITLVALVITVIVLLLLAGTTLNMILGENGLLKKAEDSKNVHIAGEKNDIEFMNNAYEYMNKYFEVENEIEFVSKLTEEEKIALEENGLKEITKYSSLRNENNVKAVIEGEVPIPNGFSYKEGTNETGLVIKNNNDNNEFVWIPTQGLGYTYNRHAYSRAGWEYSQIQKELDMETNSYKIERLDKVGEYYIEAMPQDEQLSVNKYKGYYIGRYEAGIASGTGRKGSDENKTATANEIEKKSGKPLSQPDKYVYNWVTCNQAKGLSEGLYNKTENSVTSKLCSSYAWDTMLEFIKRQHSDWITNTIDENTKDKGLAIQKTGYHSINNIYDIGGNVTEWTTENYSKDESYVYRGGDMSGFAASYPVARRGVYDSSNILDCFGFRLALFL